MVQKKRIGKKCWIRVLALEEESVIYRNIVWFLFITQLSSFNNCNIYYFFQLYLCKIDVMSSRRKMHHTLCIIKPSEGKRQTSFNSLSFLQLNWTKAEVKSILEIHYMFWDVTIFNIKIVILVLSSMCFLLCPFFYTNVFFLWLNARHVYLICLFLGFNNC